MSATNALFRWITVFAVCAAIIATNKFSFGSSESGESIDLNELSVEETEDTNNSASKNATNVTRSPENTQCFTDDHGYMHILENDFISCILHGRLQGGALSYMETIEMWDILVAKMQQSHSKYPIGTTTEGHETYVYHVSHFPTQQTRHHSIGDPEMQIMLNYTNEVLLTAGYHANDSLSITCLAYFFAKLLKESSASEPQALYVMMNYDFFVVPVVNPDGHKRGTALNSMQNISKNRRKTCSEDEDDPRNGVDILRNFPVGFDYNNTDKCGQNYGGEAPFSEAETLYMKRLAENYKEPISDDIRTSNPFKVAINLIDGSGKWGYPLRCCPQNETNSFVDIIMKELNFSLNGIFSREFHEATPDVNTPPTGDPGDWLYREFNTIAITPMIGDNDFEHFQKKQDKLEEVYEMMMSILLKVGVQLNLHTWQFNTGNSKSKAAISPVQMPEGIEQYIVSKKLSNYTLIRMDIKNTGMTGTPAAKVLLAASNLMAYTDVKKGKGKLGDYAGTDYVVRDRDFLHTFKMQRLSLECEDKPIALFSSMGVLLTPEKVTARDGHDFELLGGFSVAIPIDSLRGRSIDNAEADSVTVYLLSSCSLDDYAKSRPISICLPDINLVKPHTSNLCMCSHLPKQASNATPTWRYYPFTIESDSTNGLCKALLTHMYSRDLDPDHHYSLFQPKFEEINTELEVMQSLPWMLVIQVIIVGVILTFALLTYATKFNRSLAKTFPKLSAICAKSASAIGYMCCCLAIFKRKSGSRITAAERKKHDTDEEFATLIGRTNSGV